MRSTQSPTANAVADVDWVWDTVVVDPVVIFSFSVFTVGFFLAALLDLVVEGVNVWLSSVPVNDMVDPEIAVTLPLAKVKLPPGNRRAPRGAVARTHSRHLSGSCRSAACRPERRPAPSGSFPRWREWFGYGTSGRPPHARRELHLRQGKVTDLRSTISMRRRCSARRSRPPPPSPRAPQEKPTGSGELKITTGSTTTVSQTQSTSGNGAAVGDCVSASVRPAPRGKRRHHGPDHVHRRQDLHGRVRWLRGGGGFGGGGGGGGGGASSD